MNSTDPDQRPNVTRQVLHRAQEIRAEGRRLTADAASGASARMEQDLDAIAHSCQQLLDLADDACRDAISDWPSGVRHEIGNTLNHIIGYCELILEDNVDELPEDTSIRLHRLHVHARDLHASLRSVAHPSAHPLSLSMSDPEEAAHNSPTDIESRRILVVDDDDQNRDLLVRRLSKYGHEVTSAADGHQALELLNTQPCDLVLLDIIMPRLDGIQVLERIKSVDGWRDIPVIMISALGEIDSAVRCIELGAEDYLIKPFNSVLLRARINASLEKKSLRDREKQHLEMIETQRRRGDELLHVILPHKIVQELRESNRVEPRRHENVAVMFADIRGFTHYCDTHRPEDVVMHLQRLVESWERVAQENEVQKIKTIGDAFMAAAGLLTPAECPVLNCVRCGRQFIETIRELTPQWDVRIGIHFGPVVAGVVGSQQYLYDLWGDTVNTAARVERHGEPGAITLSQSAWEQIRDVCQGEPLGQVQVKGKGAMEMVRLV